MKAALTKTAVGFAPVVAGLTVGNIVAKQGVLLLVVHPNEAVAGV